MQNNALDHDHTHTRHYEGVSIRFISTALLGAAVRGYQTERSSHYALASIDDQMVFVSSTQVCYTVMYASSVNVLFEGPVGAMIL